MSNQLNAAGVDRALERARILRGPGDAALASRAA